MAGLYCLSYYRAYSPARDSAEVADRYSGNITRHGNIRLRYFAIILSLPEVFLLWSIVSFTVATLGFNFGGEKLTVGESFAALAVLIVVGFGLSLVIIILWYVWGKGSVKSRIRGLIGGSDAVPDEEEKLSIAGDSPNSRPRRAWYSFPKELFLKGRPLGTRDVERSPGHPVFVQAVEMHLGVEQSSV